MYRLYNPNSGEHFYTAEAGERDSLSSVGWDYEGVEWTAPLWSDTPVYRLYSGTDHHYCTSWDECCGLVDAGWEFEGTGWYSDDNNGVPLWRQYNPNVDPSAPTNNSGSHNYTTSKDEHDFLCSIGWVGEDIGWYGVDTDASQSGSESNEPSGSSPVIPDTPTTSKEPTVPENPITPDNPVLVVKPSAPHYLKSEATSSEITAWYSISGSYSEVEWELYENDNTFRCAYSTTNTTTFSYLSPERTYNLRARIKSNDVWGEWSALTSLTTKAKKAQYDYELQVLNPQELYTGSSIVLYVKTKNPETNFSVFCDTARITTISGEYYADVRTKDTGNVIQSKQPLASGNGYVCTISLDTPGNHQLYVVEYDKRPDGSTNYYSWTNASKPITASLVDFETARNTWMDQMIAKYCSEPGMTQLEKLTALCIAFDDGWDAYGTYAFQKKYPNAQCFKDAPLFTYVSNDENGKLLTLVADAAPTFVKYKWDSYVSPAYLELFARKLGFTEVENLYPKYPYGTAEWTQNHWFIEVTYEGQKYRYGACPLSSTGKVTNIKYLDI